MRKLRDCFVLSLLLCVVAGQAVARENWSDYLSRDSKPHLNAKLLLGVKQLSEDDWKPADQAWELGAEFNYHGPRWPVGMSLGLLHSRGEGTSAGTKFYSNTTELHAGVKKIWINTDLFWFQPHVAGGVGFAYARAKAGNLLESGSGLGVWGGMGCSFRLSARVGFGIDLRYSTAKVRINHNTVDAGGLRALATVGYWWDGGI